jgi:hypothetical protein
LTFRPTVFFDLAAIVPDVDPSASQPTPSLAVQEIDLLLLLVSVTDALVAVLPKSTFSGETENFSAVTASDTVMTSVPLPAPPETVTSAVYSPGVSPSRWAESESFVLLERVPDFAPNESQLALSLAVQLSFLWKLFLRVTVAVEAVLPKSTSTGETTSLESLAAASALGSKSTGEEELHAAAMAAHTTRMAAQHARRTYECT